MAVPADAGKRHRLPENRRGELGPGGSDRARQRAGDRRARLAHRRGGRKARNSHVLHGDYPLCRRVAGRTRQAARLAGTGQADAEKLDRQEPRGAHRLPVPVIQGGKEAGEESGILWVFTTRADTLLGATYVAVAAEHPLALHAAQAIPNWPPSLRNADSGGVTEAELATQEKKGDADRLTVTHPLPANRCRCGSPIMC
jgi:hypothetical protein